ncbi:MAG TPA: dTMP kinase [Gemmatimonas aurantiaca]|nr:dTMP kinase [Gemmatimonas aurantiaca]HCT57003.1 dTMP kinase [Gemmatimonas aurantiaca]
MRAVEEDVMHHGSGGAVEAVPGLFVVLEGGEGVGKTTQWNRLASALRAVGHEVVAVREPGGTQAGDAIRTLLLDPTSSLSPGTEALLFAASRAQLVADVVEPALARGAVVLVDRFLLSTYAYQGAGRGLPLDMLSSVNRLATGGRAPDLTLLLNVPLDLAMARVQARGAADRMELEDAAFHVRVQAAFVAALSSTWQQAHPEIGPVIAVPAQGDIDTVTVRCLEALVQRWPARFTAAATSLLHAR